MDDPTHPTEDEVEDDQEAAIHKMMGFSSFNTGRKRNASDRAELSSTALSATSSNSIPLPIPRIPPSLTPSSLPPPNLPANPRPAVTTRPSTANIDPSTSSTNPPNNTDTGSFETAAGFSGNESSNTSRNLNPTYTSNAASLPAESTSTSTGTSPQMRDITRPYTTTNAFGDTVFFRPSFIDPDPWRYVKATQIRQAAKANAVKSVNGEGWRELVNGINGVHS